VQAIGIVKSVCRFPVKSMGGEQVNEAFVSYAGLTGDRAFAFFTDAQGASRSGLTARQHPSLLSYAARYAAGALDATQAHPEIAARGVEVVAPEGQMFAPDERLLERLRVELDCDAHVRRSERGMVDAFPLSIISTQTIDALSKECGLALDPLRFRANFYVEWNQASAAFFEDDLVGRELMIGEQLRVQVAKRDSRCKIISLDPVTTKENREVLKTVAKHHEGCAGVYAVVLQEGIVRSGDVIALFDPF
jgi:uncharacterized protein